MRKNKKYNPHAIVKLIEDCVRKTGSKLDSNGYTKTQIEILDFVKAHDGLSFHSGDLYLYQRRNSALAEALKGSEFGMHAPSVEAMSKFLDYLSFSDFETKNTDQIDSIEKAVLSNILSRPLSILHGQNPQTRSEWLDKYLIGARVIPTLFGLIPLALTLFLIVLQSTDISNTAIILVTILFIALGYGLSGWLSTIGKKIEDKVFHSPGKRGFPTSYLMLFAYKSEYSTEVKQKYRDEVTAFFGIEFPTQEEEKLNEQYALQKLHEATFKVKNNVKTEIIRSSNIRYGKIRNLIPSSLMGIFLSLGGFLVGVALTNQLIMILLGTCLGFYLLIYLYLNTYKSLLRASRLYAKYLLEEFLSRV